MMRALLNAWMILALKAVVFMCRRALSDEHYVVELHRALLFSHSPECLPARRVGGSLGSLTVTCIECVDIFN